MGGKVGGAGQQDTGKAVDLLIGLRLMGVNNGDMLVTAHHIPCGVGLLADLLILLVKSGCSLLF